MGIDVGKAAALRRLAIAICNFEFSLANVVQAQHTAASRTIGIGICLLGFETHLFGQHLLFVIAEVLGTVECQQGFHFGAGKAGLIVSCKAIDDS